MTNPNNRNQNSQNYGQGNQGDKFSSNRNSSNDVKGAADKGKQKGDQLTSPSKDIEHTVANNTQANSQKSNPR